LQASVFSFNLFINNVTDVAIKHKAAFNKQPYVYLIFKFYQYPGFCVIFTLASLAGWGIGISSPLPVTKPVAKRSAAVVPTEFLGAAVVGNAIHVSLVVPVGVPAGAGV
jgi:hypothetical protein